MFKVNAPLIRTLMFKRGIGGIYELAQQAGLNPTTTSKSLKDGSTVTAKTLNTLARFFSVDINELILNEF